MISAVFGRKGKSVVYMVDGMFVSLLFYYLVDLVGHVLAAFVLERSRRKTSRRFFMVSYTSRNMHGLAFFVSLMMFTVRRP